MKSYSKFLPVFAFMVFQLLVTSCGDDDNGTSCNQLYTKIATATGELLSPDCDDVVAAYDKLIDLYDEGRDCKDLKEDIEDEGYDSVDDFIAELQETRDDVAADCAP
jgi:hypothetical protein